VNRASLFNKTRTLGLIALAALALAGCGRRGDLEAPLGAPRAAEGETERQIGAGNPIDGVPVRRDRIVPPRDPFILDKIL
jgi:predicted small lipoprotein YifL